MFRTALLSIIRSLSTVWCISLAFIIRIYHDARPSECQIPDKLFNDTVLATEEHYFTNYFANLMRHFFFNILLACLFCDFVSTGLVVLHRVVRFLYGLGRQRKEVMVALFKVSVCP
jgi:hypothetical protein